jgi:hypothetical protein
MPESTTDKAPSAAAQMFGEFAPALVHFTDDVLFGEVWQRPDLAPRDRSLITVAALVTNGNTGQLTYHLELAKQRRHRDRARRSDHPPGVLHRLAPGHVRHGGAKQVFAGTEPTK